MHPAAKGFIGQAGLSNRERNGLDAPNTSNQNREGATGTSSKDHFDAIPISFGDQTNINYRDHSQSEAHAGQLMRGDL
jgi:hypothetical protein